MKIIEPAWAKFRLMVLPLDMPPDKVAQARLQFYAGASFVWCALQMGLDAGPENTASDMEKAQALQDEVDDFGRELDARVLELGGTPMPRIQ